MKKYFLSANTCLGYVNFYPEETGKLDRVYTLSGISDSGASEVIKKIAEEFFADALILNPVNPDMAYGCIINNKGIFSEGIKNSNKTGEAYEALYSAYEEAKKIHDDWEKIYISNIDFERLNAFSAETILNILGNKRGNGKGINSDGFFGASTPEKPINFINELTKDISKRYFIKGRPGTGKSTFLKKLRAAANEYGFDTETYYCSFDPKSLDMVVIRELSVCVFDSTAPHELFPERADDEILDFYVEAGLEGTDEKYSKELNEISSNYNALMNKGKEYLKIIRSKECTGEVCEDKSEVYDELKQYLLGI